MCAGLFQDVWSRIKTKIRKLIPGFERCTVHCSLEEMSHHKKPTCTTRYSRCGFIPPPRGRVVTCPCVGWVDWISKWWIQGSFCLYSLKVPMKLTAECYLLVMSTFPGRGYCLLFILANSVSVLPLNYARCQAAMCQSSRLCLTGRFRQSNRGTSEGRSYKIWYCFTQIYE